MVIGFLWYGVWFRRQWMHLMGFTIEGMKDMKMSANKAYLLQFIASLVMAYVLAGALQLKMAYAPDLTGLWLGVCVGLSAWLGFVAPVTLGTVLWENKRWKLWFINAGSYLVTLVVMGIILSLWG